MWMVSVGKMSKQPEQKKQTNKKTVRSILAPVLFSVSALYSVVSLCSSLSVLLNASLCCLSWLLFHWWNSKSSISHQSQIKQADLGTVLFTDLLHCYLT